MAPHNHNYYNPVGTQLNQQQPSNYANASSQYPSQATANTYPPNYGHSYSNSAYANQQYAKDNRQQQSSSNASVATQHSFSTGTYSQPTSSSGRSGNVSAPHSDKSYYNNAGYAGLNNIESNQANNPPLYASNTSTGSTFGRLSIPNQSQTASHAYGDGQTYQPPASRTQSSRNSPSTTLLRHNLQQPQQPQVSQRYASPLHAVQMQQRGRSPQLADGQRSSIEPSPTTVNPSQIYDMRAENQRKAQIETEKRRRIDEARIAEESARAAEAEKEELRKAEQDRIEANRIAEEERKKIEEDTAKKKVAQDRRNELRRNAREEKRQSKTAATALTQMASSSGSDAMTMGMGMGMDTSSLPANEESEMRAMFQKMREFNQRNPAMLAKLWEEERTAHSQSSPRLPATPKQPPTKQPPTKQPPTKQPPTKQPPTKQPPAEQPPAPPVKPPAPSKHSSAPPVKQPAQPVKHSPALAVPNATPTLWPPHKKESLADAAARWLTNPGRHVSTKEILDVLDTNPNYVQLCEAVEVMGVKFQRSALAKELLKTVPDGLRSHGALHVPKNQSTQNSYNAPQEHMGQQATVGGGGVVYQTPTFVPLNNAGASDITKPSNYSSPAVVNSITSNVKAEAMEPRRPPANKEEAARKRTFTDLVDLTKEDSDDEPPRKKQQPLASPVIGAVKHHQSTSMLSQPVDFSSFMRQTPPSVPTWSNPGLIVPAVVPSQPQPRPVPPVNRPRPKGPTEEQKQSERMRGKMLVEPIMRDRVARKSKYVSSTIARDVLLATGRHPDLRALNAHLSSMQKLLGDHGGAPDGGGNKSDLSTIRWDIIDPYTSAETGKPQPESATVTKSVVDKRTGGASFENEDMLPLTDDGVTSKRRIAERLQELRDVAYDTELHKLDDPEVLHRLNSRLTMRKHRAKTKAQSEVGDVLERGSSAKPREPKFASPGPRANNNNNNNNILADTDDDGNLIGRSNSKNSTPGSKPSPLNMSSSGAVGYAAFRQYDENGSLVKKKGRPFGWRKNVHSREAAGLTPTKKVGTSKSSSSHLRQSTSANNKEDFVMPQYQVYGCKWHQCTTELDNLERLKKHLVKFHGVADAQGDFQCLWQHCRFRGQHIDANGRSHAIDENHAPTFDTIDEWIQHVDKEHLAEVAWELGDGPKGGTVLEHQANSDVWLSDSQGRSVTPIIVPRHQNSDSAEYINVKGAKPSVESTGLMSRNERAAASELQKLEDQKRAQGFTMGHEGSVLATETGKKNFLDNEDFEDVVEDSEPEAWGFP